MNCRFHPGTDVGPETPSADHMYDQNSHIERAGNLCKVSLTFVQQVTETNGTLGGTKYR
jgi:hypothetical protein